MRTKHEYFSADYFESRKKFRELVTAHGGDLKCCVHPSARGPNDEQLTVDYAILGHGRRERVLFNVNGVHGIEAFPGAAAQLQWMDQGGPDSLCSDVCVVLVHNLNPFGWAHGSQLTEERVDLNRNFIDFGALPQDEAFFALLAEAWKIDAMSFGALDQAWSRMLAVGEKVGPERLKGAMISGQYSFPDAVKYGGRAPAWSNEVLRDIAGEYLSAAQKIVYLDWHTGLGDYGDLYELHSWRPASESWQITEALWGADAMQRGAGGFMTSAAHEEEGGASMSDLNGVAQAAVMDAAPGATVAGGVIEFGTVPWDLIAQAAILDHWLMFENPEHGRHQHFWKAQLRTMFSPRDPRWEASVLTHSRTVYERMIRGLEQW